MKKILCICLAMLLFVPWIPNVAYADDYCEIADRRFAEEHARQNGTLLRANDFILDDMGSWRNPTPNSVYILRYAGNARTVTIPRRLAGKRVRGINPAAFAHARNTRTIHFPQRSVSRNAAAMLGQVAPHLRRITVARGNRRLRARDGVLYTRNMRRLLVYPQGRRNRSFVMPNGVRFWTGDPPPLLRNITLGRDFRRNNRIPNGPNKRNIFVHRRNQNFSSVNGVLYSKDGRTLVAYPRGRTNRTFTVPNSVTHIGNFATYTGALTVVLHDNVQSLGLDSSRIGSSRSAARVIFVVRRNSETHRRFFSNVVDERRNFRRNTYTRGRIDVRIVD